MVCKACGAEIAEKALICYKCGAATFEAVRKPIPVTGTGRGVASWVWIAGAAAVLIAGVGPMGAEWLDAPLAYGAAAVLAAAGVWGAVRR